MEPTQHLIKCRREKCRVDIRKQDLDKQFKEKRLKLLNSDVDDENEFKTPKENHKKENNPLQIVHLKKQKQ